MKEMHRPLLLPGPFVGSVLNARRRMKEMHWSERFADCQGFGVLNARRRMKEMHGNSIPATGESLCAQRPEANEGDALQLASGTTIANGCSTPGGE